MHKYAILMDGEWVDHYVSDHVLDQREKERLASQWNRLRTGRCELVKVQMKYDYGFRRSGRT